MSNGNVIAGGFFAKNDQSFAGLPFFSISTPPGHSDAFLVIFSPWSTGVRVTQSIDDVFNIYPNPAGQEIHITVRDQKLYKMVITDNSGKVVYQANIKDSEKVEIRQWTAGIYHVKLNDGKGNAHQKSFIVQ